jgi:hypothetical protein
MGNGSGEIGVLKRPSARYGPTLPEVKIFEQSHACRRIANYMLNTTIYENDGNERLRRKGRVSTRNFERQAAP